MRQTRVYPESRRATAHSSLGFQPEDAKIHNKQSCGAAARGYNRNETPVVAPRLAHTCLCFPRTKVRGYHLSWLRHYRSAIESCGATARSVAPRLSKRLMCQATNPSPQNAGETPASQHSGERGDNRNCADDHAYLFAKSTATISLSFRMKAVRFA